MDNFNNINVSLKQLVHSLLNNSEQCDKTEASYISALSHIARSKPISPSESEILCYFDKLITRFDCESFPQLSEKLRDSLSKVINWDHGKDNRKWRILFFLMRLCNNPFRTEYIFNLETLLEELKRVNQHEREKSDQKKIDWEALMKEGNERFQLSPYISENEEEEEEKDIEYVNNLKFNDNTLSPPINNHCSSLITYKHPFDNIQTVEYTVKSEREEMINVLIEATNSQKWLLENVQQSRTGTKTVTYKNLTGYSLRTDWMQKNSTAKSCVSKMYILSTYKIIRELLLYAMLDENSKIANRRLNTIMHCMSIPTLSQETFKCLVNDYLVVVRKYQRIISFCKTVRKNRVCAVSVLKYSLALRELCQSFTDAVTHIEQQIIAQENSHTLITMMDYLKPFMNTINFLYDLHNQAIPAKKLREPAWLTVTRLLSVLYTSIDKTISTSFSNYVVVLFVRTLEAYINIMDSWLSEGTLQDLCDEFIIARNTDAETENVYIIVPFEEELLKQEIQPANILINMADKLIKCSYNVEILQRLNKLATFKQNLSNKGCLYDDFHEQIKLSVQPFSRVMNNKTEATDRDSKEIQKFFNNKFDPFLMIGFGDVGKMKQILHKKKEAFNLHQLENAENINLIPVQVILHRALENLIESRDNAATNLFKYLMLKEYHLFDHIQNLGSFLLMDCHTFCSYTFEMVYRKELGRGHYLIPNYILSCIESNKLKYSHLFFVSMCQKITEISEEPLLLSHLMKCIDSITLKYKVSWPISLIITDSVLETYYVPIFRQVLKLTVSYSIFARIKRTIGVEQDNPMMRRLHVVYYWILQLLHKIKSYLMPIVQHHFKTLLTVDYINLTDINTARNDYEISLNMGLIKCFENCEFRKFIQSAYAKLWNLCDSAQQMFNKPLFELSEADLNQLMESYVQCVTYFIRITENALKRHSSQFFNSFAQLRFELKSIMKSHNVAMS